MKKTLSLCMAILVMSTVVLAGCSSSVGETAQTLPVTAEAESDE